MGTGKTRTKEAFSDDVTPDIDGFIDEPIVGCDVQVGRKYFYR